MTDSFKLVVLNLVQLAKHLEEVVLWEELHEILMYLIPFTNEEHLTSRNMTALYAALWNHFHNHMCQRTKGDSK